MANTIKPKRSNTASKVPNTSELVSGELGVNMADKKVYINNGTSVVQVGAGVLSALGDVTITSPTSGQGLSYNGTAWVNTTGGGSGTVTSVGITPSTGVTVSNSPITTSGNITVGLSTKLTAIENLSGAGFFTQNGSGAIAGRTIQAGTGISVAHGNGSSQDPTISNSGVLGVTATSPIASSGGQNPVISLNNTSVTAGSYTNTNITVDAQGRITAAANGSAGGVTSVTGTAPVVSSGGATPAISMAAASSGVNGFMSGAYATKLDGIAAGATNVTNTNQLTNGAGFITSSGTSAACSGNAATATTLSGDQSNWASLRTNAVANMLSWKNYGNGHIIFDASQSTSPTGTAVNNANAQNAWTGTFPTLMGWNGANTYGVRVDSARISDSTSGSSASCTGNAATATNSSNTSSVSNATGGAYTWTGVQLFQANQNTGSGANPPLQAYSSSGGAIMSFHRGGVYAVNMGLDSDNVFRIGGWSAGANRLQMDMSGNLTMAGFVSAFSDERKKKNWRPVTQNFVEKLANVKVGIYDRIDEELTQVGVSAQSLQKVLPEAVLTDNEGFLSVAYGNAALTSAVELAKEIVELKAMIKELKTEINNLKEIK